MAIQESCRILNHRKVTSRHYKLTLFSSYISSQATAGQFVNIRCGEFYDPLLRRPFSVHRISREHQKFEILYEVVGKGTELLSRYSVGSELDILGPLGSGFKIDKKKTIAVLVGGGMGVAPLLMLADELKDKIPAIYVLIGTKTRDLVLCEQDFKSITDQVLVATDDGSYGKKGVVSDILLDFIDNQLRTLDLGLSTIFACGPKEMLRIVADIAYQKRIGCQLSMEEHMACGVGACYGCATKTKTGYQMVCKDGPIFEAEKIIWQT